MEVVVAICQSSHPVLGGRFFFLLNVAQKRSVALVTRF